MEAENKTHWQTIFATKGEQEVSWFQTKPETSIQLVQSCKVQKDVAIIDIGGGDSYLIDSLLDLGYTNLSLLDISENAIQRSQQRIGKETSTVQFIVSNSLDFVKPNEYAIWHDRASFHFLTDEAEIQKYKSNVLQSLQPNGHLLLATFSEEGPLKCSGLPITQYSVEKMEAVFGDEFELENCFTETHTTPFDTQQEFIFFQYKKR